MYAQNNKDVEILNPLRCLIQTNLLDSAVCLRANYAWHSLLLVCDVINIDKIHSLGRELIEAKIRIEKR